jgi:hypothetical protein
MRCALACLLAVMLAVIAGGAARAEPPQGERELAILNRSGQAINEIYVSPSSADHWGEDRLGEATLPPGQVQHVRLGRQHDCDFDVQVVYEDASREEQKRVNACRLHQIGFDGSAAVAAAAAPVREVTLANRSARPIQQVLISPSDAGDWGEDRLGNTSISVGETATVRYRGDCVADIRVVFDNRSAEERRNVDLCAAPGIAIAPGWTTADTVPTDAQQGMEQVQLNISNRTGHRVTGLYVFPQGSARHGPQLLGSAGLADGASVSIGFSRSAGICRFSAEVAFGPERAAEQLDGLDLCRSLDLVLPGGA